MESDFFATLLEKWDLGVRIKTRRVEINPRRKVTAKEMQHDISNWMTGLYPGTYGTGTTGWGPLAGQLRVEWPHLHAGGILPFDVEIVVEADESVTPEELNEKMVAEHWENLLKMHVGDPVPFPVRLDVHIVRVKGLHHKFLIGEPDPIET